MTEDQEVRFLHAYDSVLNELEGAVQLRDDPVASQEAFRMAKVRLNEMETVLREMHG